MTCIYAVRSDGLGVRLNAIFNGLLISELLKVEFKFSWPKNYTQGAQFQSVPEVQEIFSGEFIQKYLVSDSDVPQGSALRFIGGSVEEIRLALLEQISGGAVIVTQQELLGKIVDVDVRYQILLKIRNELRFTSILQSALDKVIFLKTTERFVAIHIRAGDIIYGRFFERPFFYSKIIPTPLVLFLINSLRSEGRNVALFGQEAAFIGLVTIDYGLFVSPNFFPDQPKTPLNLAFQDICGMGMSDKIVCGSSGFARFSSQYFGIPIAGPWSILPKVETINEMANFINRADFNSAYFSEEQCAYAFFYAFQSIGKSANYEQLNCFMEGARRRMPKNRMYLLWDVLNKIRFGKLSAADEAFENIFLEINLSSISEFEKNRFARILILNKISGKKELTYSDYFSCIEEGACKSLACGVLLVFIKKRGSPVSQEDLLVLRVWQDKFKKRIFDGMNPG